MKKNKNQPFEQFLSVESSPKEAPQPGSVQPLTLDIGQKNMTKKIIIFLAIIVVLFLALTAWLLPKIGGAKNSSPSSYSAVYLRTGDVYFGKLSWFPKPQLSNVWLLQRSVDEENNPQVGVVPLDEVFWGPIDKIYFNASEVVFWTSLRNDSPVIELIDKPRPENQTEVTPGLQNMNQ